jgi:MerR family transcriptional regulator, light-induced transcriptional regulator
MASTQRHDPSEHRYRIGELSRRVGVGPETLRAWERRYGLLDPVRSEGNYRLYSPEDERRVRRMLELREEGVAAAEAARLARGNPQLREQAGYGAAKAGHAAPSQAGARVAGRAAPPVTDAGASAPASVHSPASVRVDELVSALERFDEAAVNELLDRAFGDLTIDAVVDELILPALRRIGDRWAGGEATVAQEHFASNLLRGRMHGWARGWGGGRGPAALLACPPGERHDLALLAFGLLLRERGWRVAFLGADTPTGTIAESAVVLQPDAIVVASLEGRRLRAVADELRGLAADHALFLAGAGASRQLAERLGARFLEGEPVHAARVLDGAVAASAPAGAAA